MDPFVAGVSASVATKLLVYPMEISKLRCQAALRVNMSNLYRGCMPFIAIGALDKGIYFKVFQKARTHVGDFCGGMLASSVSSWLMNPAWISLTNYQVGVSGKKRSWLKTIHALYAMRGLSGFFKGSFVTMCGCVETGIFLSLYERLKRDMHCTADDGAYYVMAPAIISKSIALFAWYPQDLLRTRVRISNSNLSQCIKSTYANEGIGGFYKGAHLKFFTSVPQSILLMLFYENILKFTQQKRVCTT